MLSLGGGTLAVGVGSLLHLKVGVGTIMGAIPVPDPRPTIVLPAGLSVMNQQWGRDMLCVITSYDDLVRIDFREEVKAAIRLPNSDAVIELDSPASQTIKVKHLLLSLEKLDEFLAALHSVGRQGHASL